MQIAYCFLVFKEKTSHTQQAEAFPVQTVGIASAAPAQANYLIRILYLDSLSAQIYGQ